MQLSKASGQIRCEHIFLEYCTEKTGSGKARGDGRWKTGGKQTLQRPTASALLFKSMEKKRKILFSLCCDFAMTTLSIYQSWDAANSNGDDANAEGELYWKWATKWADKSGRAAHNSEKRPQKSSVWRALFALPIVMISLKIWALIPEPLAGSWCTETTSGTPEDRLKRSCADFQDHQGYVSALSSFLESKVIN